MSLCKDHYSRRRFLDFFVSGLGSLTEPVAAQLDALDEEKRTIDEAERLAQNIFDARQKRMASEPFISGTRAVGPSCSPIALRSQSTSRTTPASRAAWCR